MQVSLACCQVQHFLLNFDGVWRIGCSPPSESADWVLLSGCVGCLAQEEEEEEEQAPPTADDDLGASKEGSRTDAEAVERYDGNVMGEVAVVGVGALVRVLHGPGRLAPKILYSLHCKHSEGLGQEY